MSMTGLRTAEMLATAVEEQLDGTYDLVYVSYDDELPKGMVAAMVRGDNPWETEDGDRLMEWESEAAWRSACDIVDDIARTTVQTWEQADADDDGAPDYDELLEEYSFSDQRQSAIDTVRERDSGGWWKQMVRNTPDVLLRVGIEEMDEDAGLGFTDVSVDDFLARLGFDSTPNNVKLAQEIIANASPEFSVVMGYALAGVGLDVIETLPEDGKVAIINPHIWFGSPFTGSGWCDGPFQGTLIVDRGDLRTDKDAFGYGWGDVIGGARPSDYSAEIVALNEDGTVR